MSEERNIWPTATHLNNLRESGVYPKSRLAVRLATGVALALLFYLSSDYFEGLISAYRELLRSGLFKVATAFQEAELCTKLKLGLLVPAVTVAVTVVSLHLASSRFYFRLGNIYFDIRRLSPFQTPGEYREKRAGAFGRIVALLLAFILTLLATAILFRKHAREIAALLNLNSDTAAAGFKLVFPGICVSLFIFGIASLLLVLAVNWVLFRLRHRMSIEELKREGG